MPFASQPVACLSKHGFHGENLYGETSAKVAKAEGADYRVHVRRFLKVLLIDALQALQKRLL